MKNGLGRSIAYFSMEVALENAVPTYSGGLGVLAGDTLRSAADLSIPMVGVSLLHRKGYFFQRLDEQGRQIEEPVVWSIEDRLDPCEPRVSIELEGRTVHVRAWSYDLTGVTGSTVPVYFLDANLEENAEKDRGLTDTLYGGDPYYRLRQEAFLGIAGVRMLRALGYGSLRRFHMNEGHAALLTLELARELGNLDRARELCVFTTHTPVPAGHDRFPMELVHRVLGPREELTQLFGNQSELNMTELGLHLSRYVNAVAKRHGEVSRAMFPNHPIDSITNGVHPVRWTCDFFHQLFDHQIPGWREDPFLLRRAVSIPTGEIWKTHRKAKRVLVEQVNSETNAGMDTESLTIGFARRFAPYKRADLLLHNPDAIRSIATEIGPIQIVYAGKAHPQDGNGKAILQRVVQIGRSFRPPVRFAFLENYDLTLGKILTSGVDLWLNTPQPPLEASGTSGMKAALNGVPSLSVLDGWWVEGHLEGVTGWALDGGETLYEKLRTVARLYYGDRERFLEIMRSAIAFNGSYFNTHRMMLEYVQRAYL